MELRGPRTRARKLDADMVAGRLADLRRVSEILFIRFYEVL